MASILRQWGQWSCCYHVWSPWPSSRRWGPTGGKKCALVNYSNVVQNNKADMLVLITHVKRGITLSNNQPAISLVKKAFSANGTEHERNADFDTLIALSPTCLFKTRCFPFQYLSICRDCSVLTMSTGFTAVSWLISVNARELESDSLPSKYKEFVSVVWCLTISTKRK